MNAPRIALERTAPALFFSRLAVPSSHPTRSYQHFLRQFSNSQSWSASSEKLASTSSYQPYPLARPPPQPRNDDIPPTSIASPIPKVHETRPLKQPATTASSQSSAPAVPKVHAAAVPEQEAQKSKPVAPERKRKLRPRKAAMKLTPTAVEQLRSLLEGPDPKLIKVGVRNRGCSGLAYHLEYVDKPGAFDEAVDQDGVTVLIDSKALFSIIGSEMDWVEDKLNQRFVFRNPNISKSPATCYVDLQTAMLMCRQRRNVDVESLLWCRMNEHVCTELRIPLNMHWAALQAVELEHGLYAYFPPTRLFGLQAVH